MAKSRQHMALESVCHSSTQLATLDTQRDPYEHLQKEAIYVKTLSLLMRLAYPHPDATHIALNYP